MYSNSYSRATFGLEAKDIHKSKGKSCGYYMRIIFFFSSLIQSLIIVSLVLFLVYGQPEKSAEERRVEELEQGCNKLSIDNIKLRKEKGDLSGSLGKRTAEKDALEKEALKLKGALNTSDTILRATIIKRSQCEADKKKAEMTRTTPMQCPTTCQRIINTPTGELKILQNLYQQQTSLQKLIEANFTQTVEYLKIDLDNAIKARNEHHMAAIGLRQENADLKKQLEVYTTKCKEDFAKSLEGIQTVTSAFLMKIDNVFSNGLTFHLTCEKQAEQVERIRSNCSSLSKQVEDKFQSYLNRVGMEVSTIQAKSSRLEVLNSRLTANFEQCTLDRTAMAAQSSSRYQEVLQSHDKQMEELLKDQARLRGDKEILEKKLVLKDTEVSMLTSNLAASQANCKPPMPKPSGLQSLVAPAQQNRPNMLQGLGMDPPGIRTSVMGGPAQPMAR